MRPKDCAYIVEHLSVRFMAMVADHSRQLAEHRAAFGARTEADRKIIEGLRTAADEQVLSASKVAYELHWRFISASQAAQRVIKERDGLLTQVQDQRAEIERLRNDERKAYQDGEALRAEVADLRGTLDMVHASLRIKPGDHIGNAIAALKAQSPTRSHPVKVGEWVKNSDGGVARVLEVHKDWYLIARGYGWTFANCEPCDPPVDHDTPAGKEAAVAAAKDEIKVGDLVEVVSNTGGNTWLADVGSVGTVTSVETIEDSLSVRLADVPGKKNVLAGYVSLCDVRKVPQ